MCFGQSRSGGAINAEVKLVPAIRWRCARSTETHLKMTEQKVSSKHWGENTAVIVRIKHSRPNVGQSDKAIKTHPFRLKAGRGMKTTKKEY